MLTINAHEVGKYEDTIIITKEKEKGDFVFGLMIIENTGAEVQHVHKAMLNRGQMNKMQYHINRSITMEQKYSTEEYATRPDRSRAVSVINSGPDCIGIAITPRHGISAVTYITHEQAEQILEY